jgi:hypothetical protein
MAKLAGDHVQVLVGAYELTGDSNKLTFDDSYTTLEQTTFGDGVMNYILGQRKMSVAHSGFMNADSARSHPVLNGVAVNGAVSVLVGQNADPAVGDPMFSLLTLQEKYQATPEVGQVIPFNANFPNGGDIGGWGVALAVPTTFTNDANGSAVDNGASSANGGAGFLHILQKADSDTYSIIIEGSATGSFGGEETTLATFTADASALTSERVSISGTIPQYVRWKATRTGSAGDTVEIAVSLIRF